MELLTEKCKDAFEKWYSALYTKNLKILLDFKKPLSESLLNDDVRYGNKCLSDFMKLPFSMQYSVYVDFFDNVGIYLGSEPLYDMSGTFRMTINESNSIQGIQCSTRQKARTEAIKKANEIFNNG